MPPVTPLHQPLPDSTISSANTISFQTSNSPDFPKKARLSHVPP